MAACLFTVGLSTGKSKKKKDELEKIICLPPTTDNDRAAL
jgi:hypothetical protein